jgi:hypothetical protein
MSHFAALYSIVFMIGFVCVFDLQHGRRRFRQLFLSAGLLSTDELDLIRRIQAACEEA